MELSRQMVGQDQAEEDWGCQGSGWDFVQFGGSGRTEVFVQGSGVDRWCSGKRTGAAVSRGPAFSLK